MTCIIGLADPETGKVFIGGDSAGVSDTDYSLTVRADEKVFTNGPFVMGFCGSFRIGNLLRYSLDPPRWNGQDDIYRFMVVDFINEVRKVLIDGGVAKKEENVEEGGEFLVGFKGRLFHVHEDFQVGEAGAAYDAAGCGAQIAVGALYANSRLTPKRRVMEALEAAEANSGGVRRPFKVISSRAPV